MNPISRFTVVCVLLLLFYQELPFDPIGAIQLASAQMQPAYFGQAPVDPSGGQQMFANAGGSNDLASQMTLLEMLQGTREKLSKLPPFKTRQCSEFNWTLGEAYQQLEGLIQLAQNQGPAGDGGYGSSMGQLHEQMDATRQLRALNAYEALGASVSLYFGCLSQLGQFGLASQLDTLLPISVDMGTLGSLVDTAIAPPSFNSMPGDGGGNQELVPERANDESATRNERTLTDPKNSREGGDAAAGALDNTSGSMMQKLGAEASQAYAQTRDFFGWPQ